MQLPKSIAQFSYQLLCWSIAYSTAFLYLLDVLCYLLYRLMITKIECSTTLKKNSRVIENWGGKFQAILF